jgi:hypothetical protein
VNKFRREGDHLRYDLSVTQPYPYGDLVLASSSSSSKHGHFMIATQKISQIDHLRSLSISIYKYVYIHMLIPIVSQI